jgi:ABC-type multidrug transport system fused ATPase/permease subunit
MRNSGKITHMERPIKKTKLGYLRYIFSLALKQRRSVILLALLLFVGVGARLTEPYLYKIVVDTLTNGLVARVFAPAQVQTLVVVVIIWFVLAVLMNVTSSQTSYLVWRIGNRSSQEVSMTGYRRLLQMDYAKHMAEHSSRYAKIVDDADTSTWEMTNWWLGRFSSGILGFVGMLIIALSVSWQMTLIAVSVIPPTLWFVIRHVKKYESEQRKVNKMWEEKHEHLSDQISNIVTYKLNPHEDIFVARQKVYSDRAAAAQLALNKRWRLVEMLNPDAFARFLVLGVGIFFVKGGSITLGTLFMFMGLLNEILTPLHMMSDILPQYTRRAQHIERLLGLLAQEDTVSNPVLPAKISGIDGEVVFDHVSFSYSQQKSGFALRDVSFTIKPGQTAALVGHSGSGKTTIMTLLTRLIDPMEGKITIDGFDLRKFNLEEIKKYVGTVLQENAMYNETVAENIAYGDPTATREHIIQAAKQAHADEFIRKLPKGYDALIGERGVRLSGGEKQRIAIARAILKDPTIVVLDEPTSALDSITEKKVQQGINELVKGRTTLIIAHRLSTVRNADIILAIEDGKIIGEGPHEELVKTCPTYKMMVDLQVEGFLADRSELPTQPEPAQII